MQSGCSLKSLAIVTDCCGVVRLALCSLTDLKDFGSRHEAGESGGQSRGEDAADDDGSEGGDDLHHLQQAINGQKPITFLTEASRRVCHNKQINTRTCSSHNNPSQTVSLHLMLGSMAEVVALSRAETMVTDPGVEVGVGAAASEVKVTFSSISVITDVITSPFTTETPTRTSI